MDVAIIADTHIPARASRIPPAFEERIRSADHVIHAGDYDSEGAFSNFRSMTGELTAVKGNMDPGLGLPNVARVELAGVEFVVTHGTGSPRGYKSRVANTVSEHATTESPVGVSGHTHTVMDEVVEGIRLLNPGSVTGAAPAERATMMSATVEDGDLSVELLER